MTLEEIIGCHKNNKNTWDEIRELYFKDMLIPFVGAGMSRPAYSTWSDALKNILDGKKEQTRELNDLLEKMKYEEAAEYVYNAIHKNNFYKRVEDEFSKKKLLEHGLSIATKTIPDLFNGLVFTTNFDKCLEEAYIQKGKNFENVWLLRNMIENDATTIEAVRRNPHNLYKIHGDIDDKNSLVFLKKEYDEAYGRKNFVGAFRTLAYNKTFLFLGCSLEGNDRYIDLIRKVIDEAGVGVIKHYAFLPLPKRNKDMNDDEYDNIVIDRINQLGEWGIFPIWFPSGKYEAVEILLKNLSFKETVSENKHILGDQTYIPKHFHVFSSELKINRIFVDKENEYFEYNEDVKCKKNRSVYFENVLNIAKENRVLFIEGGYGTGKTILMKLLQEKMIEQNYNTLYYDAIWFCKNSIDDINFAELFPEDKKLFVFIDAFDKLIDLEKGLKALEMIEEVNAQICRFLAKYKLGHVIVSSRPYLHDSAEKGLSNVAESLACDLLAETDLRIVPCVRTIEFSAEDCNLFWNRIKNPSCKAALSNDIIKRWNKKAPATCKIPLFAYVIGKFFYENQIKNQEKGINILPKNPLDIYEDFVLKTIEGRFVDESRRTKINSNIRMDYFSILKKVAGYMLYVQKKEIDYREDTNKEIYVTKNVFAINIEKFSKQIKEEVKEFLEQNEYLITSYVINNYFFSIFKNVDNVWMVRFSDINVLSCFAADQYYDSLEIMLNEFDENEIKSKTDSLKENLSMYELHPQTMDFLICKLKKLSEESQNILLFNVRNIVKGYKNDPVSDIRGVKMVLLLCIIHIKLENKSYQQIGFTDFFKVFYRLCKTAKALNINGVHIPGKHRYLVERYFMYCKFRECDFKRLNYKFYNFSYSLIDKSKFTQCNFLDNAFDGCEIRNVTFYLCMFNEKTEFRNTRFRYSIKFLNCILQGNDIITPDLQECEEIVFERCSIEKLLIKATNSNITKFIFRNCVLANIKVADCKKIRIIIDNCIILQNGKLIVSNSDIYSEEKNKFKLLPNSRIIKEEKNKCLNSHSNPPMI